jgi:hypothetical protein
LSKKPEQRFLRIAEIKSAAKTARQYIGGFDTFCGLPVNFELGSRGQKVRLASYGFASVVDFNGGVRLSDTLKGVTAGHKGIIPYFPELHLAEWFRERREEDVAIWCFQETGARPLLQNWSMLIEDAVSLFTVTN